jgi:putative phage-type endonuclease
MKEETTSEENQSTTSEYVETTSVDDSETTISSSVDWNYDKITLNHPELTIHDMADIEEQMYDLMEEYMETEMIHISSASFFKKFVSDITMVCFQYWLECEICDEDDFDEIEEIVEELSNIYFDICELRTQYKQYNTNTREEQIGILKKQLDYLKLIPQAKQKTAEWYKTRYNLITASNCWKAFGTESQKNALIYDKCKPFSTTSHDYVNTQSTLHWGVKYEPVSLMIYEDKFHTKIEDFGCIPHSTYPFVGASPDGINIDPTNIELYGRMVEIKNIFNRDITGIPKEEYWIQTQIQMETCNLDECDLFETRIKEYENEEAFYTNTIHEYKGVILHFVHRTVNNLLQENLSLNELNTPIYKYMPLSISQSNNKTEIDRWIQQTKEQNSDIILFNKIYWYVDQCCCTLIKRNKQWFQTAIPKIKDLWDIVLKERVDGYEHRAAKKKIKTEVIVEKQLENTFINTSSHIIKNLPQSAQTTIVKLS